MSAQMEATNTTGNDLVAKVKQDTSLQRAVESIMSDLPHTWTRAEQESLVWTTLALAYSIGASHGSAELGAAISKAIAP